MGIGQIGHHLVHAVGHVEVELRTGLELAQTQHHSMVEETVKDHK